MMTQGNRQVSPTRLYASILCSKFDFIYFVSRVFLNAFGWVPQNGGTLFSHTFYSHSEEQSLYSLRLYGQIY